MPVESDNMNSQNAENGQGQGQTVFDYKAGTDAKFHGLFETKGWKNVDDVLNSYSSLENMLGAQDRLVLPKDDDANAWGELYGKLGRPKDPSEYKWEDIPDVQRDEAVDGWFRKTAHSLGLNQKQAATMEKEWNTFASTLQAQRDAELKQKVQADMDGLRKDWGENFDMNERAAKKVAEKFFGKELADGIGALAEAQGGGVAQMMKGFLAIADAMGEDRGLVGGDDKKTGATGNMSPAAVQQQIAEIMADPDYMSDAKNPARHKMLVDKMAVLMGIKYPEETK